MSVEEIEQAFPDFRGNLEHLQVLLQGVECWNAWRERNRLVSPDLSGLDLSVRMQKPPGNIWEFHGLNDWSGIDTDRVALRQASGRSFILLGDRVTIENEGQPSPRATRGQQSQFTGYQQVRDDIQHVGCDVGRRWYAHLEYAHLGGAYLDDARLQHSFLQHAFLGGARLQRGILQSARLEHVNLDHAYMQHANLHDAHLENAYLRLAHLEEADLSGAYLAHADLYGAHLDNANLWAAKLDDTNLQHTVLSNADLRIIDPLRLRLDETRIRGARFGLPVSDIGCFASVRQVLRGEYPDRTLSGVRGLFGLLGRGAYSGLLSAGSYDPWSVVRRAYSGPALMFHLLFLIVFLLPYLGRAIYWRGVNEAQSSLRAAQVAAFPILEQAMSTLEDLAVGPTAQGELEELWRERGLDLELLPAGREVLQEAARRQRVQFRESVRARAIMPLLELGPCLRPSAECDSPQPLWRPLLGLHRTEDHWLLRYLAVILIVYNLFRGAFTWHVSRLRDAEERDGFSPRLQQYIRVYYAHAWGLQFLPWAAITAALFRVAEWLFLTDVILPSA